MESTKQRIGWVDIGKFICVIFVIIIHLESNTNLLGKFYEPFLLNGFLFLSGYTFRFRNDFRSFFYRKVRQLLIPWLFFGLLIVISGNIYSPSPGSHNGFLNDLFWFFVQIREKNDAMWFVAALFVAYIPFYFLISLYQKSPNKKNSARNILLYIGLIYYARLLSENLLPVDLFPWGNSNLPWHIEYIPCALFFMTNGYFFREKFETYFDKYNSPVFCLFLLFVYLNLLYGIFRYLFYYFTWTYFLLVLLRQVFGVLLLVSISKLIKPNKTMLYIGQNSLIYFGIAHYLNVPLQLILKIAVPSFYTAILSNEYYSAIFSIIFALASSFILIIPAYIINRYFPFLIGRKQINK